MTSTATKATLLVTSSELTELADWEKKHTDATKKVSAAKKELDFRRQSLAEKVLGVNSSDELKGLSPEKLLKLYAKRLEAGDWKAERGAPSFAFVKTSQGQYPSWSEAFRRRAGRDRRRRNPQRHPARVFVLC
jgi:hypothetical protein